MRWSTETVLGREGRGTVGAATYVGVPCAFFRPRYDPSKSRIDRTKAGVQPRQSYDKTFHACVFQAVAKMCLQRLGFHSRQRPGLWLRVLVASSRATYSYGKVPTALNFFFCASPTQMVFLCAQTHPPPTPAERLNVRACRTTAHNPVEHLCIDQRL